MASTKKKGRAKRAVEALVNSMGQTAIDFPFPRRQPQSPIPRVKPVGGQFAGKVRNRPPDMSTKTVDGRTWMRVRKREPCGVVTSSSTSGATTVATLGIHAGSSAFSWLSGISLSFMEWQLNKMTLYVISNQPTTVGGNIAMAFVNDYQDTTPSTLTQVMAYDSSIVSPVYAAQAFNGQDSVSVTVPKYAYTNAGVPEQYHIVSNSTFGSLSGPDKNSDSPGYFAISCSGVTATSTVVGTLFAEYDFWLIGTGPASSNQ